MVQIMKYHIEKNSVQETLVIPLYGRKLCTERFPNLFQDRKAVELIDRLDYDFSELEKQSKSMAHQFGELKGEARVMGIPIRSTPAISELTSDQRAESEAGAAAYEPLTNALE